MPSLESGGDYQKRSRSLISHEQTIDSSGRHSLNDPPAFSVNSRSRISISNEKSHCLDLAANRCSFMEIHSPTHRTDLNLHTTVETGSSSAHFTPVISPRVPSNLPSELFKTEARDAIPGSIQRLHAPKPLSAVNKAKSSLLVKIPKVQFVDSQNPVKPATTNLLDVGERADLVRKTRKLTRVFGETPNVEDVVSQDINRLATCEAGREHDTQARACYVRRVSDHLNLPSRSYSPDNVSFITISPTLDEHEIDTPLALHQGESAVQGNFQSTLHHKKSESVRSCSPISFIDLSDDGSSIDTTLLPPAHSLGTRFVDQERERRQKRERLAKLHRFLGSQVPVDLVLGINNNNVSCLPPLQDRSTRTRVSDKNAGKTWMKHHSSRSVILEPTTWSGDFERSKVDRERIAFVRRAQKMEKVFGVAPPPMLYLGRHLPSPSVPMSRPLSGRSSPPFPSFPSFSFPGSLSNSTILVTKIQKKKENRPSTSESVKHLLSKRTISRSDDHLTTQSSNASTENICQSTFYKHYKDSLKSLNDILDRDDKASLEELHQVLNGEASFNTLTQPQVDSSRHQSEEEDTTSTPTHVEHRASASTVVVKLERSRSLPSRTCLDSHDTIYDFPERSDVPSFQRRRKTAAKLTQFFGVDYRELISDVLESIENGMQVDRGDGLLGTEEFEDLLQKLRHLKCKRQSLSGARPSDIPI